MNEKLTFEKVVKEVKKDVGGYHENYKEKKLERNKLVCKKCGSENIQVQKISKQVKKKKGLIYWSVGWIIDLMLWIFLTLPRLIIQVFKPNKTVTKTDTVAVCQNCGNDWQI